MFSDSVEPSGVLARVLMAPTYAESASASVVSSGNCFGGDDEEAFLQNVEREQLGRCSFLRLLRQRPSLVRTAV